MKRRPLLAAMLLAVTCAVSPAQITSSVVRIQVGDSVGSGAYLGDRLVLSCAHLFAGENSTQVVVIEQAQAMDRESVHQLSAEQFDTGSTVDQVIATLAKI